MCIQESVRDVGGWVVVGGGVHKSRTGTDCRVRGGRYSELERISERESKAEEGGKSNRGKEKESLLL